MCIRDRYMGQRRDETIFLPRGVLKTIAGTPQNLLRNLLRVSSSSFPGGRRIDPADLPYRAQMPDPIFKGDRIAAKGFFPSLMTEEGPRTNPVLTYHDIPEMSRSMVGGMLRKRKEEFLWGSESHFVNPFYNKKA
eukprot:TRINITY_DN5889_c0_g2_i2.p1 TRINITY_DN5889_c0_g2~~TRINITY_DN5889_c0_g2_i2.p1  ORF type:complete len:135 (+),score=36.13 TRINITY_DN5889_c0_g2_i2:61-465(+)